MSVLQGKTILVVEDELPVAMGIEDALADFGCRVAGPFPTVDEARTAAAGTIDGAILDVNVRGELVFPLAEQLRARGLPIVLCSGYAEIGVIPDTFAGAPRVSKPYTDADLRNALEAAFQRQAA